MSPLFSIVIPGFNRPEPLKYTLRSAARAAALLPPGGVEILLVDDGSAPPLAEQLAGFEAGHEVVHLRQPNQGSIVARLTGLASARGEFVLFLDSDDLIHPDKLRLHLARLRETGADLTHDDTASAVLGSDHEARYGPERVIRHEDDAARLLLLVQPLPHSPVYRRDWLRRALSAPLVPPERRMDASGDVWLYYNLAAFPGRSAKVDAALSAIGPHEETRYSRHWEKLGAASLLLAEAFVARCPKTEETRAVRALVGGCAFHTWRGLPRDYPPAYLSRQLAVWRAAPRGPLAELGGPFFRALSRALGPVGAARLLRLRNAPYSASRTLDDNAFAALIASLPPSPLPS